MANRDERTGGRIVVDALRRQGVEHVFCVPGESYLDILDALVDAARDIRLVSARQEGGAAYMAESYAKLTGKPGVCLVARSPGACNASIAIHTAYQDGTPMVVIAGQIRRNFRGRGSFQEMDLVRMLEPMTKWAVEVERTADLPYYMAQAFRVAQEGRPGPVALVMPEDMLGERSSAADLPVLQVRRTAADPDRMQQMRAILDKAERPMLYVGGVWSAAARKALEHFAAANGLPVCCSFRRLDAFDHDHPNFAGEMGPAAAPELVKRVKESDVILAVGTRLGEHATQGYTLFEAPLPRQKLIHVLPYAQDFGRVFHPALAIEADLALFVEAANAQKPAPAAAQRTARVAEARKQHEQNLDASKSPKGAVELGRCMAELDKRLPGDAVLTCDAGHYTGWVQRFLRLNAQRRFLAPVSGAMGYAVPSAVMAKIVQPKRMAVALVGDGGFGMTGNEIATAAACGAAPIVVIFNNGMLGSIRAWQEISYPGRVSGTDLANPDYVRLAEAHGGFGARIERTDEFVPALEAAVRSGKLAVLDLRMDREAITTRVTLTDIREAALKRKSAAG